MLLLYCAKDNVCERVLLKVAVASTRVQLEAWQWGHDTAEPWQQVGLWVE